MNVICGKVKETVLKYDVSWIAQTIIKRSQQKDQNEIALELKGKYCALVQNRYSQVAPGFWIFNSETDNFLTFLSQNSSVFALDSL